MTKKTKIIFIFTNTTLILTAFFANIGSAMESKNYIINTALYFSRVGNNIDFQPSEKQSETELNTNSSNPDTQTSEKVSQPQGSLSAMPSEEEPLTSLSFSANISDTNTEPQRQKSPQAGLFPTLIPIQELNNVSAPLIKNSASPYPIRPITKNRQKEILSLPDLPTFSLKNIDKNELFYGAEALTDLPISLIIINQNLNEKISNSLDSLS